MTAGLKPSAYFVCPSGPHLAVIGLRRGGVAVWESSIGAGPRLQRVVSRPALRSPVPAANDGPAICEAAWRSCLATRTWAGIHRGGAKARVVAEGVRRSR